MGSFDCFSRFMSKGMGQVTNFVTRPQGPRRVRTSSNNKDARLGGYVPPWNVQLAKAHAIE
jgi:hypothetical protein